MDQLSSLLRQFSISAGVFYSGQLCGLSDVATGDELVGHIHVLRSGSLSIQSKQQLLNVVAPSLIFSPNRKPIDLLWMSNSQQNLCVPLFDMTMPITVR